MKNGKRILAAIGTATLLISNLGAVSQAVFAENEIPGWESIEVPATDDQEIIGEPELEIVDETGSIEGSGIGTNNETGILENPAAGIDEAIGRIKASETEIVGGAGNVEKSGVETADETGKIEGSGMEPVGEMENAGGTGNETVDETGIVEGSASETGDKTGYTLTDEIATAEDRSEAEARTGETRYEQSVDGITVIAYAAEHAFNESVTLAVQMITRQRSLDSIERQLTESDAVDEFDDFIALDVHFENENGIEIEPGEGLVTVSFALAEGFLPEEADKDTLAIQHFDESGEETEVVAVADTDETNEETATIVTHADSDKEDPDANVQVAAAEFEVENFSTFTLTWQNSRRDQWFEVTLHFVDEEGNDVGPARQAGDTLSSDDTEIFFSAYRNKSDTSLTYKGAYYGSADGQEVTSAVYSEDWQGGYGRPQSVTRTLTFVNGAQTVATLTRNSGGGPGGRPGGDWEPQRADVYLVYASDIEEKSKIALGKTVTYNNNGTYDLALSVSGASGTSTTKEMLDILFIIDKSGSMDEDMDGNDTWNDSDKKIAEAAAAVESLTDSVSSNEAISARYSVVQFSNYDRTNVLVNWTDSASTVNTAVSGIRPNGGTNYQAGIREGISQLDDSLTRSGAEKVVIFLTDGEPTYYIYTDWWGTRDAGNGGSYDATAQSQAEEELQSLNCDSFYAIGVGNVFSDQNSQAVRNLASLVDHVPEAVSADSKGWYAAANAGTLNSAFDEIAAKITNILSEQVIMVDPISANVDVLMMTDGETPVKLVVEVTNADGNKVGTASGSTLQMPASGNNNAATLTALYENGAISLVFPDGYRLEQGYTYSVVTTIEPSASAYAAYAEDPSYSDTADMGTGAHEGEAGYYSNENSSAKVTYYYNGKRQDDEYFPRPVVHVYTRDIRVTKVWEDSNDQDGLRPESIKVSLYANGSDTGKDLELSADNNWTGAFTRLRHYQDGQEISYTIKEDIASDSVYTSKTTGNMESGYTITNSYTPETVTIRGTKIWNDADDQDGKRPENITVRLLADGNEVKSQNVTASSVDASGNWTFTFEDVAKKSAGQDIAYTVSEDTVTGYTTAYDQTTYTITNSSIPETTSVKVTKEWNDNDNQDGKRPANITVYLLADGKQDRLHTFSGDSDGKWEYTFTNLPKYKNGKQIAYTVSEQQVTDYGTPVITGDAANGYVIKNNHTPETTAVSVSKTWNDNNNQDGKRPASVIVTLYADGAATDQTVTLSASNDWQAAFSSLDKYSNGKAINYTVVETPVEGYTPEVTGSAAVGYAIENSYTPETTYVTVIKEWSDGNDQDGRRPASVTVTLYADNVATDQTVTLSDTNGWQATFSELDKYKDGREISYSVQEAVPAGYIAQYSTIAATNTVYIENAHTPETTSVRVTKTWSDANNQDNKRPSNIKVNLLADGSPYLSATVTAADNWAHTFDNLPMHKVGDDGKGGHEIVYTVTEEQVENYSAGYKATENGYDITNSYTPEQTSITVNKAWADRDNQDGVRPTSVTVTLVADGEATDKTLTLSESNNWQGTFSGLNKYRDAGTEIRYTVQEENVADGYTVSVSRTAAGCYTITNTHTPKGGTKTKDHGDHHGHDSSNPVAEAVMTESNVAGIESTDYVQLRAESPVGDATGDSSHMVLYGILMVIACGALVAWLGRNRIRK